MQARAQESGRDHARAAPIISHRQPAGPIPAAGNQARLRAVAAAIRRQGEGDPAGTPATVPSPAAPSPAPVPAQAAPGGTAPKLYGMISLFIDGPLSFSPWAVGAQQEPGVGIYSPKMSASGTVIADSSVTLANYEIGFLQLLAASDMTLFYNVPGGPTQTMHIGISPMPIRDSEAGSKPWSKAADTRSLDKDYVVNNEDRPRNMAPWQTPDRKGKLVSGEGYDYFCTWLAARNKISGNLHALSWANWTVDWACTFDPATQTGQGTGKGGQQGPAGDGQGPLTPLTGDPIANDSIKITWRTAPSGPPP